MKKKFSEQLDGLSDKERGEFFLYAAVFPVIVFAGLLNIFVPLAALPGLIWFVLDTKKRWGNGK